MRKSKMLAKFRSGGFARVCGLGHYLPFFVRYAAHFRYDGIWLDLEHRAMDAREVQALIGLCKYNDIDCMVRPPTLERTKLYRYLEDGAAGFLVPLVSDPQMAYDLVQAVKYPPIGNRGLDGAGFDGDYGLDVWVPGSTYTDDANRETFLITQVETPGAVANADEIASIEGIDGLFIGPADLGLRIANAPAGTTLTMEKAIETVAAAAQKHNKVWGITAGSVEEIKRFRAMGAQLVPWGGDFALMNVLKECSLDLDGVPGAV
jgi:2-keto-3-deoxy-L-rhamnonate aldolase RhmA